MGDERFRGPYHLVREAADRFQALVSLTDDEVVQALAHASRERDPLLANVLATEALNRMRRSRTAFNHLGEGLIAVDPEGRITSVTPTACRLMGITRDGFLGRDFADALGARTRDDAPMPRGSLAVTQALQRGIVVETEAERYTRADGTLIPVSTIAAPIIEDGDVFGAVVTFFDITSRREAEARQAAVVEAALDGIITIDESGNICEFNAAAQRMLGHTRETVIGRRLADIIVPPDMREAHLTGVHRVAAGGPSRILGRRIRVPALCADGNTIQVELAITQLPGLPIRFTGFLRDLTEELTARASAREASERYAQLVSQSPLSMQIFSPDGATIATNAAWERLWGVTLEQLGGYNVLHDVQLEKKGILPILRRAFAGETVHIPPTLYDPAEERDPRGRARWVEARAYPLFGADQRVEAVVLIHDDVTERIEAGRRTALTHTQAQLLIESVRDFAICMLDAEGRVVSWNAGSERMNGYSADEIIGQHVRVFHTPEAQAAGRPERALEQARVAGSYEEEGWLVRKSGTRYWGATTLTAIRTAGGLVGFAKVVRDLSEPRAATQRVREQEHAYRELVENSPEPMGVHAGGKLLFINRAGARLLGADDPAQLVGRSVIDFVAPESRPLVVARLQAMTRSRDALPPAEEKLLRVDGTPIDVETVALPIQYEGRPAVQLILRDISHRKLADAHLRKFNAELEQRVAQRTRELQTALHDLETFTNSASHDLRAPLRGVTTLASDLRRALEQGDAATAKELATLIQREGAKANRLVADLLSFAKSGRAQLRPTLVDVTRVVHELAEEIQSRQPERTVDWSIQPGMQAYADQALLRIALDNLLSNAAKYCQRASAPTVTVTADADDAGTTLRVRDNGIGFAQEEAYKLFSPFQRLSSAQGFEGTGLGLASVHRIITRHGGTIRAQGQVGQGAEFVIHLPRAASGPSPP